MPLIPSAGLIPTLIIQRILQTLGSRSSLKFPDENIRSLQLFFDPAQILLFFVSTGEMIFLHIKGFLDVDCTRYFTLYGGMMMCGWWTEDYHK